MENKHYGIEAKIMENYTVEEIKPFCSFCGLFAKYMIKSKTNASEIYYICSLDKNGFKYCREQLKSFIEDK